MKRAVLLLAALGALLAAPAVVSAQFVPNPGHAEFVPSADHDTMFGGLPLVTRYELRHYVVGQSAPVAVFDLGKPTPDAGTGLITVPFPPLSPNIGIIYVARVAVIGPEGESVSEPSNQYGFSGVPAAVPGAPTIKR